MSGSRWVITLLWLSGSWRSFLYSSFVYSCYLFLIFSASVRSIPILSFIVLIFAWMFPASLIFLKKSLAFPILLFSSISLHWLLKKAFLSLLAIRWNSAFKWVYLSFSHDSSKALSEDQGVGGGPIPGGGSIPGTLHPFPKRIGIILLISMWNYPAYKNKPCHISQQPYTPSLMAYTLSVECASLWI